LVDQHPVAPFLGVRKLSVSCPCGSRSPRAALLNKLRPESLALDLALDLALVRPLFGSDGLVL
ncbi:MAG: hypothetical protein ACKPEY_04410, partial [Planctomycetota bacterium]